MTLPYCVELLQREKVILAACFTLRDHGTHIDLMCMVFLSGRQDLPSDARAFSLTTFEA